MIDAASASPQQGVHRGASESFGAKKLVRVGGFMVDPSGPRNNSLVKTPGGSVVRKAAAGAARGGRYSLNPEPSTLDPRRCILNPATNP